MLIDLDLDWLQITEDSEYYYLTVQYVVDKKSFAIFLKNVREYGGEYISKRKGSFFKIPKNSLFGRKISEVKK